MGVADKINAVTSICEHSRAYRGRICAWPSGPPLDAGNPRRNCEDGDIFMSFTRTQLNFDTYTQQKTKKRLHKHARGYLAAVAGIPALLRASSFRLIGQTGDKTCARLVH